MKYVAAASDKTVSLRREPFWVFRIFVKCNIASQEFGQAKDFRIGNKIFTTDEYGLLIEKSKIKFTWSTPVRGPALKSCEFPFWSANMRVSFREVRRKIDCRCGFLMAELLHLLLSPEFFWLAWRRSQACSAR
jgi:hypothetical protein